MDFSLITHTLKDTIETGENAYRIDVRTTKALQALAVMGEVDETIPDEVRYGRIIELMLDTASRFTLSRNPKDYPAVYAEIIRFLDGWPEEAERPTSSRTADMFSFTEDHAFIVAAFRQAYGISLKELKALHWWEFRALLAGIPEDTTLSKVMHIRAMEIDPKEPPKVRMAKQKAKAATALHKKGGKAKTGEEIVSEAFSSL